MRTKILAAMMFAGIAACAAMLAVEAQQPKVTHTQLTTRSGNLQSEIAAAKTTTWLGYSVATKHRIESDWDGVVHLEGTNGDDMRTSHPASEPIPPAAI